MGDMWDLIYEFKAAAKKLGYSFAAGDYEDDNVHIVSITVEKDKNLKKIEVMFG